MGANEHSACAGCHVGFMGVVGIISLHPLITEIKLGGG